uniref:Uncharacterized protein n=1 Tax=Plectus sambesii TaxID=2011161 RepID=A0A914UVU6_9BILA
MNRRTDQAGMITEVADRRPECNQSPTTATLLQRIDRRLICERRRSTRTHAYRSNDASSVAPLLASRNCGRRPSRRRSTRRFCLAVCLPLIPFRNDSTHRR